MNAGWIHWSRQGVWQHYATVGTGAAVAAVV